MYFIFWLLSFGWTTNFLYIKAYNWKPILHQQFGCGFKHSIMSVHYIFKTLLDSVICNIMTSTQFASPQHKHIIRIYINIKLQFKPAIPWSMVRIERLLSCCWSVSLRPVEYIYFKQYSVTFVSALCRDHPRKSEKEKKNSDKFPLCYVCIVCIVCDGFCWCCNFPSSNKLRI